MIETILDCWTDKSPPPFFSSRYFGYSFVGGFFGVEEEIIRRMISFYK